MKTVLYCSILFCLLAAISTSCKKEEQRDVSIDIDIHDPVISDVDGGGKKIDFTVEITQIGNYFHQNFDLKISKFRSETVLDSFHMVLPTAREFVHHSVIVSEPGDYWVDATISSNGTRYGRQTFVKVPQ